MKKTKGSNHDYHPREDLGLLPGSEAEDWPDIDEPNRMRQVLSRRAFAFGLAGGREGELPETFGQLIKEYVKARIAKVRGDGDLRLQQLDELIAREPAESLKAKKHADDADQERDKHERARAKAEEDLEKIRARRTDLTPSQRGGRFEGKEGVVAATSTGLLDGAVFALMIQSLAGSVQLRVLVALGLTLAYTVIVAAAGRILGELWGSFGSTSARAGTAVFVALLAALLALSGEAIVAGGEFRADAIASLARGLPASPDFLIWVQGALTLAATCAIGAYHAATEGEQLRTEEERLRREIEDSNRLSAAARDKACDARDLVLDTIASARAATAEAAHVANRVEHQIAEEEAYGETLARIVQSRYEEGRKRRETLEAGRPKFVRTFDEELVESLRRIPRGSWLDASPQ